jgi:AraC-like DNA-binding protein
VARASRFSLAEPPEITRMGAYSTDSLAHDWHQTRSGWQLLLFDHPGQLAINGTVFTYLPGGVFVVPPGSRCHLEPSAAAVQNHFFMGFVPADSGKDVMSVPVLTQLPEDEGKHWEYQWREAMNQSPQTRTPRYAMAWALLWRISRPLQSYEVNIYVERALAMIDAGLGGKVSIAAVAREVEISHSQLIRMFRSEVGVTPIQYVRERRAEVARKLLTTTSRSIKSIAAEVGVSDLQQFNKLIRDTLGASPRQVRRDRWEIDYFRSGR